jgi:hypothetical protein
MDKNIYEIFINNRWVKVNFYIFRSWTGPRSMNSKVYQGPRFILGTDDVIEDGHVLNDLCCDCGNNIVNYKSGEIDGDIICWYCQNKRFCAEEDAAVYELELIQEGWYRS